MLGIRAAALMIIALQEIPKFDPIFIENDKYSQPRYPINRGKPIRLKSAQRLGQIPYGRKR